MSKNFSLTILALFIAFYSHGQASIADDTSSANTTDQTIATLENRFFEHQYSNDTDADRLNRLDQFVFGCNQTGSPADRLQHLTATIPDETMDKVTGATNQTTNTNATDSNNSQQANSNINDTGNHTDTNNTDTNTAQSNDSDQSGNDTPAGQAFAYSSYPSVTSLEQELFGHTYANDTLAVRLSRLETKAFGAPSTSNDLSKRVDNLEDYAQRNDIFNARNTAANTNNNTFPLAPFRNHQPAVDTTNQNQSASQPGFPAMDKINPFKPQSQEYISKTGSFVGSIEERISMMEAQEFRHTYPDRPLEKRLKKLESKILPNQDDSQLGIFERTGKLWVALHPADQTKVDNLLDTKEIVDDRIVDKGSANTSNPASNMDSADNSNTNNNNPNNTQTAKRSFWLNKLGNSIGSPNSSGNQGPDANQSFAYPYPGTYTYGGESSTPAGYYQRSYGASFGPGAGPAGLPVGFW